MPPHRTVTVAYLVLAGLFLLTWIAPGSTGYGVVYVLANAVVLEIVLTMGALFFFVLCALERSKTVAIVNTLVVLFFGTFLCNTYKKWKSFSDRKKKKLY